MTMWLWPVALATIIVVVILLVGRSASREASGGPEKRKEPLDILKERYARGEIDDEEFEERKRKLQE